MAQIDDAGADAKAVVSFQDEEDEEEEDTDNNSSKSDAKDGNDNAAVAVMRALEDQAAREFIDSLTHTGQSLGCVC